MTIRELVRGMQKEILSTDLQPERAAELVMKLAALIGNTNDEIREADQAYAVVLLAYLDAEPVANRAKIRAETTPAYLRKREARDTKELVLELVRSLKYFLKAKADEHQYAGHQ